MTDAERRLWYRLRAHRLDRMKFKRQVPVGPYIVDFANLTAKVVIEVDGGQHADNLRDEDRDRYLIARGFSVLRFWNNDVLRSTGEVLKIIVGEVNARTPSPGSALRAEPPSPRRGEGK
jgi:very-short-patch-repair endonuclease